MALKNRGLGKSPRRSGQKQSSSKSIPVVWSAETPERRAVIDLDERNKRSSFGTLASIPALFGIYMANYIIRKITGI